MGLLGGAIGAIGKIAGGAGGGGIVNALQKGVEVFGGIKGLIDQAKGLGGGEQAGAADQKQGEEKAGGENPLVRLAKMILEAKPEELEKLVTDLKGKVPKELAGVIDKLVEARQQAGQKAA